MGNFKFKKDPKFSVEIGILLKKIKNLIFLNLQEADRKQVAFEYSLNLNFTKASSSISASNRSSSLMVNTFDSFYSGRNTLSPALSSSKNSTNNSLKNINYKKDSKFNFKKVRRKFTTNICNNILQFIHKN